MNYIDTQDLIRAIQDLQLRVEDLEVSANAGNDAATKTMAVKLWEAQADNARLYKIAHKLHIALEKIAGDGGTDVFDGKTMIAKEAVEEAARDRAAMFASWDTE